MVWRNVALSAQGMTPDENDAFALWHLTSYFSQLTIMMEPCSREFRLMLDSARTPAGSYTGCVPLWIYLSLSFRFRLCINFSPIIPYHH